MFTWDLLAWVLRVGAFAAGLLVVAALWVVERYAADAEPAPGLCRCAARWEPLDVRWRRLLDAAGRLVHHFGPGGWAAGAPPFALDLSVGLAAAGHLVAWFLGRASVRVPYDDLAVAVAAAAVRGCGCVRGPEGLVPVIRAGPGRGVVVERLCPSLVARHPDWYRVWVDELDAPAGEPAPAAGAALGERRPRRPGARRTAPARRRAAPVRPVP